MSETTPLYKDDDAAIYLKRVDSSSSSDVDEEDIESLLDREELEKYEERSSRKTALLSCWLAVSSGACYVFRATGRVLRPSFFPGGGDGESEQSRGGANGALDGLRGVACFIVACYHFFGEFFDLDSGYNYDPDLPHGGHTATFLNLPFFKALHYGPNMVAIFFAISGYVLTHRFVNMIRRGNTDKAIGSLPSAIFRRWMRLFAPVGVSFALLSIALQLGAYDYSKIRSDEALARTGRFSPFPKIGKNPWDQFMIWQRTYRHLIQSFSWLRFGPIDLDPDAWTISIEYRCSIVVFVCLIALAKVKKLAFRLGFLVLIMAWAVQWEQRAWEVVLFVSGLFLAECNVATTLKSEKRQQQLGSDPEKRPSRRCNFSHLIWLPVFLAGWFFSSVPSHTLDTPKPGYGWYFLARVNPIPSSDHFNTYQFLGAFFFVAATTNWTPLIYLLNRSVPQYLGRLSFALYLVHGPWMKCIGWATVPTIMDHISGKLGSFDRDYNTSAALGFLIFLPSSIYFADIFMRYVDAPSVKLSRRLWDYCCS